jgi:hypothetical protein
MPPFLIHKTIFLFSTVALTACAGGNGGSTGGAVTPPTSVVNLVSGNSAVGRFAKPAAAPDGSTSSSLAMMTGTFDIVVAAQAGLTCKIDADGDGVFEYIRPNCTSFQQAHVYRLGSAVGVTPKMQILNSSGAVMTEYNWYARLDEDTILPNASRATWDKAGVTYITPSGCDIAVGATVNATTIQTAIDSATASSQVTAGGTCYATIPAGTHSITNTINLKSGVILRGTQGAQTTAQTILSANISGAVISAAGGGTVDITYTGQDMAAYKNKNYITVPVSQAAAIQTLLTAQTKGYLYANFSSEAEYFRPQVAGVWHPASTMNARLPFPDLFLPYREGTYRETCTEPTNLARSNPWCVRPSSDYSVGQWVKIVNVQGTKLVIDGMINESYPDNYALNYKLDVYAPNRLLENAGLEDFAVTRTDANNVDVIQFNITANSYARRLDIQKNFRGAIAINNSYACEANKNYIHAASSRGDGGNGYGVVLQSMTTSCLVFDNILTGQRHGLMAQYSANGNVFSENYAPDGADANGIKKADFAAHGHFAHMNLVEGNYLGNLQISDWHGRSPFHAVYRNRITTGVQNRYASWGSAFVDNVIEAGYPGVCFLGICGGGWTAMSVDKSMALAPIGVNQIICFRNLNAAGIAITAYDTTAGASGGTTNLCNNTVAPVVAPPNSYYRTLGTIVSTTTNAARTRAISGNFIW